MKSPFLHSRPRSHAKQRLQLSWLVLLSGALWLLPSYLPLRGVSDLPPLGWLCTWAASSWQLAPALSFALLGACIIEGVTAEPHLPPAYLIATAAIYWLRVPINLPSSLLFSIYFALWNLFFELSWQLLEQLTRADPSWLQLLYGPILLLKSALLSLLLVALPWRLLEATQEG